MNIGDPIKYSFTNEQGQPVTIDAEIADIYVDDGYVQLSISYYDEDGNFCMVHWIPASSKDISYAKYYSKD